MLSARYVRLNQNKDLLKMFPFHSSNCRKMCNMRTGAESVNSCIGARKPTGITDMSLPCLQLSNHEVCNQMSSIDPLKQLRPHSHCPTLPCFLQLSVRKPIAYYSIAYSLQNTGKILYQNNKLVFITFVQIL